MTTITIHPKMPEEISLFEYLAKRLNTPYIIDMESTVGEKSDKIKPSDFLRSISKAESEKMYNNLAQRRTEWERNT